MARLLREAWVAYSWVERLPLTTDQVQFLDSVLYVRVEFVVDSLPCFKGFSSGPLVFLPPQKSTFLNSNSIMEEGHKFISYPDKTKVIYLFSPPPFCMERTSSA
jgi:hypothetical protein